MEQVINTYEFVKERIDKNKLPLDVDKCMDVIIKYETIYPGVSETKRFFYYVLNTVGGILNSVDHDIAELFGNLKVKGKSDITFYEFEDEFEYFDWLQLRADVYRKLQDYDQLRLLNYVEISTMNTITDIITKCDYELIYVKRGNVKISSFKKTGYGTDQDAQSFIKFLANKFNQGYSFRPVI